MSVNYLTILMPCLNEEETIAVCINKAFGFIKRSGITGEVLIADNGSTDNSVQIAESLGARVVYVNERGYGAALFHGSNAAFGEYIIMGDSDDSYDFGNLDMFLEKFSQGYEFVMGNRFKGSISPGAMPWKNKWIGNPILSLVGRVLFRCPVGDFHCGLRGIKKSIFLKLDLRTRGMEYASEMVLKATHLKLKTAEVPITLHKDGRSRPPHLRPWRDGWRHLRFMLILSPKLVFLIPGLFIMSVATLLYIFIKLSHYTFHEIHFGINTLMFILGAFIFGYVMMLSGIFIQSFIVREKLILQINSEESIYKKIPLMEFGIIFSFIFFIASYYNLSEILHAWKSQRFGSLNIEFAMNDMFFCTLFLMLGVITLAFSFFTGALTLPKR